eukprot:Gb_30016 [translate_table: standard]
MATMIASALGSATAIALRQSPSFIESSPSSLPTSSASSLVRFRPIQAVISKPTSTHGFGFLTFPQEERRKPWIVKAAEEEVSESEPAPVAPEAPVKKKAKVVVKGPRKQRLVLKFMWLEKNIGLALDQVIPGHGTVPLSPYYFWPRKDAWEELKAKLESKPWISQKRTIILLNQATDIINLWQQSGSNL